MNMPSLLLLASPDDAQVRALAASLSDRWAVTICVPRALEQFAGPAEAVRELRRRAEASALVLYLSSDGAQALAGLEGLVEVYAPAEFSLCRLSPEERTEPEAWEAVWRRERDLARRARFLVVEDEEKALKARLLYGVTDQRIRRSGALEAVLSEALAAPAAPREPTPRFTLALNDYLVGGMPSGGAVRVRQGLEALGEDTLLLSAGIRGAAEMVAPHVLQLSVPKGRGQKALEADFRALAGSGLEDIMTLLHAPAHPVLTAVAADLAQRARVAVFEHCYMASLLDVMREAAPALPIVYDAHNVESLLKRELLAGHPAEAVLCPVVEEVERRLVDAAGLVLCCSEADAAAFRPQARKVVMMPHGIALAPPAASPGAEEPVRVGFLGSSHPPNVAAAQFILERLAPLFPQVVFEVVGSVCGKLTGAPANVELRGILPEAAKNAVLSGWTVALNPVESGSGASLKLADYLAQGLPTVNTPHAARGFERVAAGAGLVVPLDAFPQALERLLAEPGEAERLRGAARQAAEAQSWPAVAAEARQAIDALVGDYRPEVPPALLAIGEAAARKGRLDPRFGRIDMVPEGDVPGWPSFVDKVLAKPRWAAAPWDGAPARARAWLQARPEAWQAEQAGCAAYGIEAGGERLRPQFGLLVGAGVGRIALEWRAREPIQLMLRYGKPGGAPALLLDQRVEGDVRLVLPLQAEGQPLLLEGVVQEGNAAALSLLGAEGLLPERRPLELRRLIISYDDTEQNSPSGLRKGSESYGAIMASEGLSSAQPEWRTPSALDENLSVRRAVAARYALGLEKPFALVVEAAEMFAAPSGFAVVHYAGGQAVHQDADGVLRKVHVPLGSLLLSAGPPCVQLVLRGGAEGDDGLERLAELAGVPVQHL